MGMRVNGQDYLFKKNGRVISKGCTIPTGSGSDLYLPFVGQGNRGIGRLGFYGWRIQFLCGTAGITTIPIRGSIASIPATTPPRLAGLLSGWV